MIARIAHDPGSRVETHRSRIEERGAATSMFLAIKWNMSRVLR
jgi:hypothetical protein